MVGPRGPGQVPPSQMVGPRGPGPQMTQGFASSQASTCMVMFTRLPEFNVNTSLIVAYV